MGKRIVENDTLIILGENGEKMLSITEIMKENTMFLMPKGSINMKVSPDFEDELTAAATICNQIIVDFSGVDVISSAGIKALLMVQRILDKRADSMLKLKAMKPEVYEMFDDMGFVDLFEIEN